MERMNADLRRARDLVTGASRITALTGAGISTDSGIPDFRGPNGLWTRDPEAEKLSNLQDYLASADVRRRAWQARLGHPAWQAKPNPAHDAFVALQRGGALTAIITQNIDELHQRAGSDPETVIELHGTMFHTECLGCGDRRDMAGVLDRVRSGVDDPPCTVCGGILKSATISFGQALDADVLDRARVAAISCDVLVAAGTSLTVHPAAGLVDIAVGTGASVIICNASPTPYDDLADVVLREPLAEVLPQLT
ncbi:NAD-dependent deacetylase [Prauserella flava]|nr:NAD-dependent deacetylase [Prauserella flava]MCR3733674.1 NAD-dependent deacetylase [Prauserella salsuginis]